MSNVDSGIRRGISPYSSIPHQRLVHFKAWTWLAFLNENHLSRNLCDKKTWFVYKKLEPFFIENFDRRCAREEKFSLSTHTQWLLQILNPNFVHSLQKTMNKCFEESCVKPFSKRVSLIWLHSVQTKECQCSQSNWFIFREGLASAV